MYARVRDSAAEVPFPFATFADGHRSQVVLESVVRSAQEHKPLDVA
jgi:hypothetical protein